MWGVWGVGRGSERKVGGRGEKERERFKIVHQVY